MNKTSAFMVTFIDNIDDPFFKASETLCYLFR